MRILHLSDSSLPDWRIEKSALSSKNKGYSIFFGGKRVSSHQTIFDKVYEISWTSRSRNKFPYEWYVLKKQMMNVIKDVRPDIIHAHNVFSAKMARDIGDYPLVYDNHEYWSVYLKRQLEADVISKDLGKSNLHSYKNIIKNLIKDYIKRRYVTIWSKLEKELIRDVPTITVSDTIIADLKKIGKKIFLVPNFPLFKEIEWIGEPVYHQSLSSVYAGVEPKGSVRSLHRNLEGFVDIFENDDIGKLYIIGWNTSSTRNVHYRGFLDRTKMYNEMRNHSIGIIPFKKHWSHVFISPNKAYEYAHAGLFVMSTSGFSPVFEILQGHCLSFDNNHDLKNKLSYMDKNLDELYSKRLKMYQFARNNLLWEKYENNIFKSYKAC